MFNQIDVPIGEQFPIRSNMSSQDISQVHARNPDLSFFNLIRKAVIIEECNKKKKISKSQPAATLDDVLSIQTSYYRIFQWCHGWTKPIIEVNGKNVFRVRI